VLAPAPGQLVPCLECGQCCGYLAVGINTPSTPSFATDVLWYLYHERVSVHRDVDGEWAVVFETRCRHIQPDLRCAVYEQRPHICRRFDETSCEVNAPDNRDRVFRAPAEFLDYLRGWKPRVWAQIQKRFVPEAHRPPEAEAPADAARPRRRSSASTRPTQTAAGRAARARRTARRAKMHRV
jgi:hypothetical protein